MDCSVLLSLTKRPDTHPTSQWRPLKRMWRSPIVAVLCLQLVGFPSAALARQAVKTNSPHSTEADPFEPINRHFYALNDVLDRVLFRPVSQTYRRVLPRPVRHGVHNVLGNLGEPIVFLNDALQMKFNRAARTAVRFAGNTTVGIFGIFDVATPAGLAHHDNSFAVTMGRAGVGPGPYLFLPGIGPTTVRDLAGSGVDLFTDPLNQMSQIRSRAVETTQVIVGLIDTRASNEDDLKTLHDTATDPYATLRSVYLQQSEFAIQGDETLIERLPELPGDLPDAAAPQAEPMPVGSPDTSAKSIAPPEGAPAAARPAPTASPQGS
jgi:phospholipid-binding lipoprotein MlaA